jgi:PmbA protein
MGEGMLDVTRQAVELALAKGAGSCAGGAYKVREVEVQWRDGALEKIAEATTRGLGLSLYVDGRYSAVSTSDLREEALGPFIENAIALTRALTPDPYRALPDPKLYAGRATLDLELFDPRYDDVTPAQRLQIARQLEEAARSVKGADKLLSVTTSFSDTQSQTARVHSNGFEGEREDTSFWMSAQATMMDADGRRPEDYSFAGSRFFGELPDVAGVGREATERTLGHLGATKGASRIAKVALDHRVSGRLLAYLMGPLAAAALQQKRSFLEGKVGATVGSPLLDVIDDPLVPRGFGSRLWDGEGIAAKRFPLLEAGVLRNYYVDNYYGKKLGLAPTTARMSNLSVKLGSKSLAELLGDMGEGLYVTGFVGGNSNGTTGDFSLGFQGFAVRDGKVAEPVSEMNLSGSHLEAWHRLAAVGNDPYPYSAMRTPTLVFDGIQVAGA